VALERKDVTYIPGVMMRVKAACNVISTLSTVIREEEEAEEAGKDVPKDQAEVRFDLVQPQGEAKNHSEAQVHHQGLGWFSRGIL
jgi:hypothetical protein